MAARRRTAVVSAVLITIALVFVALLVASPALAESRDDAVKDREASKAKIADLEGEMEGIDSKLVGLAKKVEQSKLDLIDLQDQLNVAEQKLADAEREHTLLVDQLDAAESMKSQIEQSIKDSKDQETQLQIAVGSMAREMYRGDGVSPLQVVVRSQDMGDMNSRAAAASALSRVQSQAMDQVRAGLVVAENQSQKQQAVTERIADLENKAKKAADEAQAARDSVATSLGAVQDKLSEQQKLESQFEARKGEAESELNQAKTKMDDAVSRIAEMDKKAAEQAKSQAGPPSSGSGMFAMPFRGNVELTSHFGYRWHPIFGTYKLHDGTDWGAACGMPQYATRAGVVADAGYDSGGGNFVTISHGIIGGQSYITQHLHLSSISVSVGQSVDTNTVIGLTGTTGNSTGCHLHLSLFIDGTPVDILPYM